MMPLAEHHADLAPSLSPGRPALAIARHSCRAYRRPRRRFPAISRAIDALPIGDRPDGLMTAYCDSLYKPAGACLSALLALLPDAPSDGRTANRGSFGVELDGRLFLAVWDEDGVIYKGSDPVSNHGCYRLFDVAKSAVLDLTPHEVDAVTHEPPPAPEATPPWASFAAGDLGWTVSYHPDLIEAMRSSKGQVAQVMPALPVVEGRMPGAFVFRRLDDHPGELYSLTR
jgi:hypothetical protein